MRTEHVIQNALEVRADAAIVWREITQVDLASLRHPALFAWLGIPKPVRAEIVRPGVGGARIAHFSNGHRFSQDILEWQPPTRYAFTFRADPGFRVGHFIDLSDGPFRMISGTYQVTPTDRGVLLRLTTRYELLGAGGVLLRNPVKLVLHSVQSYLLKGIRANAERRAASDSAERASA